MDKSWMKEPRMSRAYLDGVDQFLDFAFANASDEGRIACPCKNCVNLYWRCRETVHEHLVCDGFLRNYTQWTSHGEMFSSFESTDESNNSDDMHNLVYDAFGISSTNSGNGEPLDEAREGPNEEANKFYKLVEDAEQELYPGCKKFSKLSFIVRLFHIKCLGGWSNKSFTMLLELLKEALPRGETLPKSFYEAKKIIGDLGLNYNKIDACPNDCILYWRDLANVEVCPICSTSRWKDSNLKDQKIAAKVVRHFPLKPRLQRLFMSSKTSSDMRWHAEGRTKDGLLRHPADSLAWKNFDERYLYFSSKSCNVRLGLASDGFNPYKTMSITHSTWPVVLVPYNLPPWMCLKQPNIILSLLIPGPSAPGNDIDVYLQPLIEELRDLWEIGVDTYDASKNETFRLRAALMWTISDFPAYANLSGWSTKGRFACPSCNKDTCYHYLKNGHKFCYMGHRRFLELGHKFRYDSISFDGKPEFRFAPIPLSGSEVLEQLVNVNITYGKKRKRHMDDSLPYNWKKKSIFFQLPYWKYNLLRHSLDVMHIEKNVCDSILGTLLNLEGKAKDNLKARLDLQVMNIRHQLHPRVHHSNKTYLPPACFSLNPKEKNIMLNVFKSVKVPDGYAANISRCVNLNEHKISGLKSHDCHIIMQQLLPIAVRGVLPKNVSFALIELSSFFRELCFKVGRIEDLKQLESQIAITLCNLEKIFPPSFFDIMVHLPIHLANEAMIAGPVHYRWMYPIERFLLTLKCYVRNRSRPEGSIAEGYLAEECLTFCSRYLQNVETRFNRMARNDDDAIAESQGETNIFAYVGRAIRKSKCHHLDYNTLVQAHRYVLFNTVAVEPFIKEHEEIIRSKNRRAREKEIRRIQNETFHEWFRDHVQELCISNGKVSEEIKCLARGPDNLARCFEGFIINGFRFHTKNREKKLKTQNCGVAITANTDSFSSSRDANPTTGLVTYYGVLTDIIELDYYQSRKIVLFKCDWIDGRSRGRGIKEDIFGFKLVNLARLCSCGNQLSDEPFILASQAEQVFYVQDPTEKDWHVVIKTKPRDLFEMDGEVLVENAEVDPISIQTLDNPLLSSDGDINCARTDIPGIVVDTPLVHMDEMGNNYEDDSEFGVCDENDIVSTAT